MFMVKQHNSFLIYALLSRIKLCRDYALFGGHFWQKFYGWGHESILKDRVLVSPPVLLTTTGKMFLLC